jgi:hypothetical protein
MLLPVSFSTHAGFRYRNHSFECGNVAIVSSSLLYVSKVNDNLKLYKVKESWSMSKMVDLMVKTLGGLLSQTFPKNRLEKCYEIFHLIAA